jgi:adenine phosphoribosyltransferase
MSLISRIKSTIRDVEDFPKPGIIFKDITPLLTSPLLTREITEALAEPFRDRHIDAVAAIEARGFIFGSLLAQELNCSFIPIRKAGKLPYKTRRQRYDLEYGSAEIEVHIDAIRPGTRVLVHDDLLATGGTATAAGELIKSFGATLAGFSFVVNLGFLPGEKMIRDQFGVAPQFLIKY